MDNINIKVIEIKETIEKFVLQMDQKYRFGPSIYFYEKVHSIRKSTDNITLFLNEEKNIEYLYSTLLAWDMNSRGAKMRYFTDFKKSILDNIEYFKNIEKISTNIMNVKIYEISEYLKNIYNNLNIMYTDSKLVSTSKLLHFLFPDLIMPMDRTNTLKYFYNNTGESSYKFLEILEFSQKVSNENIDWDKYIYKSKWNTTIPKIIDNAIILKMNISISD
jgi:hypothetical protein